MVKIPAPLKDDSISLALFESLVEYSTVETALQFFKRYQGHRIYFCNPKKIKARAIQAAVRKDFESGNYRYFELAKKYGKTIERVWKYINRPSSHAVKSMEMFNYLCDLLGEENTLKMYDRYAGCDIIVCMLDSLLREERNIRMCKLYKKGVSIGDLTTMFKVGSRQVYNIINPDRRGQKSKGA